MDPRKRFGSDGQQGMFPTPIMSQCHDLVPYLRPNTITFIY